jgi:peptidoglycan/LPS O-acetylase OafA/YrhL
MSGADRPASLPPAPVLPAAPDGYRPDIDGLRAIAVLAVVAYHVDAGLLPGGFVGVDAFLVVSGLLVTRQLLATAPSGIGGYARFLAGRIRRLAPTLLLVLAATLVAAQLLLRPDDATNVATSALWSLAGAANLYFWLFAPQGYFDPASAESPLLHLWSLALEEQFYLLWPLLLALAMRWAAASATSRRLVLLAVGMLVLAAASFALGQLALATAPGFAYYMLPARCGPLLLGAALALAWHAQPGWRPSRGLGNALGAAGLALVASACVLLSGAHGYPGVHAIAPALGAALVLAAGRAPEALPARLLALAPFVLVGQLSYAIYLWHWPLLAFHRHGYGEPGIAAATLLLEATLLLAWLTHRFVEQPLRRVQWQPRQVATRLLLLPGACVAGMATLLLATGGYGIEGADGHYARQLAAVRMPSRPTSDFDYVCQRDRISARDLEAARCVTGADGAGQPTILLWGDSNAAHYVGMVSAFARHAGARVRNVAHQACPPVPADAPSVQRMRRPDDCRRSLQAVWAAAAPYDVVVLAASWYQYPGAEQSAGGGASETTRRLVAQGKRVILLGRVPTQPTFDRLCREKALRYPMLHCDEAGSPLRPEVEAMNNALRELAATLPGVTYHDANDLLCPDGHCPVTDRDGDPLYHDSGHLTMAASWWLGAQVLARDGLPAAFASFGRGAATSSAPPPARAQPDPPQASEPPSTDSTAPLQ